MRRTLRDSVEYLRYPNAAGKIVSNGPYSSVSDLYNIKGLTGKCGMGSLQWVCVFFRHVRKNHSHCQRLLGTERLPRRHVDLPTL